MFINQLSSNWWFYIFCSENLHHNSTRFLEAIQVLILHHNATKFMGTTQVLKFSLFCYWMFGSNLIANVFINVLWHHVLLWRCLFILYFAVLYLVIWLPLRSTFTRKFFHKRKEGKLPPLRWSVNLNRRYVYNDSIFLNCLPQKNLSELCRCFRFVYDKLWC